MHRQPSGAPESFSGKAWRERRRSFAGDVSFPWMPEKESVLAYPDPHFIQISSILACTPVHCRALDFLSNPA
jgi:hypothetical protein